MTPYRFKSLLGALFLTTALTLSAETALLGNKSLGSQTLDDETTKAVLLGKKLAIGDSRVVIVIAKASPGQDAFLQAHVGMSTSQFQNHWRRLFMTGGGTAPKIAETEDEAIKVATDTAGAIVIGDSAKAGALSVLAAK